MASTPQVITSPRMQTPRTEPREAFAEKQAGVEPQSPDVRPLLSHRKAFEDAWSFVNHCKSEHETAQRQQQLYKRTEECVRLRQRGVMVQKQGDLGHPHTLLLCSHQGLRGGHGRRMSWKRNTRRILSCPAGACFAAWTSLCNLNANRQEGS